MAQTRRPRSEEPVPHEHDFEPERQRCHARWRIAGRQRTRRFRHAPRGGRSSHRRSRCPSRGRGRESHARWHAEHPSLRPSPPCYGSESALPFPPGSRLIDRTARAVDARESPARARVTARGAHAPAAVAWWKAQRQMVACSSPPVIWEAPPTVTSPPGARRTACAIDASPVPPLRAVSGCGRPPSRITQACRTLSGPASKPTTSACPSVPRATPKRAPSRCPSPMRWPSYHRVASAANERRFSVAPSTSP